MVRATLARFCFGDIRYVLDNHRDHLLGDRCGTCTQAAKGSAIAITQLTEVVNDIREELKQAHRGLGIVCGPASFLPELVLEAPDAETEDHDSQQRQA